MTIEDILEFFQAWGLHISDGVDPCSGEDYKLMREAAEDLSKMLSKINKEKQ